MANDNDVTDISSDYEITAVETDAFDKQELITWASKLELESIDYRNTSIELLEALGKLSKSLTDSLNTVKKHLFDIKLNASEKDRKLKNFIEITITEEIDNVYDRISQLTGKFKDIENHLYSIKIIDFESTQKKLDKSLKIQDEQNKIFKKQFNDMNSKLENILQQQEQQHNNNNNNKTNKEVSNIKPLLSSPNLISHKRKYSTSAKKATNSQKKINHDIQRINKPKNNSSRGTTFTRKLIFD